MVDRDTKNKSGFFPKHISNDQAKDTGMAMCLISLLVGYIFNFTPLIFLAILLLLINMVVPTLFRPIGRIWFGLSIIVGTIVSCILLTLLFFTLVTPVGIVLKCMGKDSLKLKEWKKGKNSVFDKRYYRHRAGQTCNMCWYGYGRWRKTLSNTCASLPKAGAQCGSSARWDLCGGRRVA